MELLQTLLIIFGGVIPSFIGWGLLFCSKSEKISRIEVLHYTCAGLLPTIGWAWGLLSMGFAAYVLILADHQEWWNHEV